MKKVALARKPALVTRATEGVGGGKPPLSIMLFYIYFRLYDYILLYYVWGNIQDASLSDKSEGRRICHPAASLKYLKPLHLELLKNRRW